jgi:molybdenum cofactor cytidylyltransferase
MVCHTLSEGDGIGAILLAAGASRRMGTPKPMLEWGGQPLVRQMALALREGGASRVLVVVRADAGAAVAEAIAGVPDAKSIVNPSPERGMLSSVQEGVRALVGPDIEAFFVSPCDLPKLQPKHVAAVLAGWRQSETAIAVPIFTGRRGHPTLFGAKLADEILSLNPLEFGLNEILKRHAGDVREIDMPDDGVLRDADTPDEWRALQDEMRSDRGFRDVL